MSLLQLNRIRSGFWIRGVSGDTIVNRDVVCLSGDELWVRADADGVGTMPAAGIAMDTATAGQAVRVLMVGTIENSAWTWNPGATLYVSTAPGALTESAPTAPDIVQAVAYAYRSNLIYFDPDGISLGTALGCPILEGATAYVGFDECKEPFTNYFLCDGTADDVQIQEAIDYVDALGEGEIFLEEGTFTLSAALAIDTPISIIGSGVNVTNLVLADGANYNMFNIGQTSISNGVTFKDFHCDGNKAEAVGTSHCIRIFESRNFYTERVYITGFNGDGIHILNTTTDLVDFTMYRTTLEGCADRGLYVQALDSDGQTVERLFFGGIYVYANRIGVELNGRFVYDFHFNNVSITANDEEGMIIRGSRGGEVSGLIHRNKQVEVGTHSELLLDVDGVYGCTSIIFKVVFQGARTTDADSCVESTTNANAAVFTGCWFFDPPFTGAGDFRQFVVSGSRSDSGQNPNGIARGVGTILNGANTVVVAHGLLDTPDVIVVTGTHAEVETAYVDTVGAANFTIHKGGAGNVTANRDVYWIATTAKPDPWFPIS